MESLHILFLAGRDPQPCHGDAEERTAFAVGVVWRTAPFTFYNSHHYHQCITPRFLQDLHWNKLTATWVPCPLDCSCLSRQISTTHDSATITLIHLWRKVTILLSVVIYVNSHTVSGSPANLQMVAMKKENPTSAGEGS